MNVNTFINFFLPKDNKFIPLLKKQADDLVKASGMLVEFISTPGHEERKTIYAQIKEVETHCDSITDEIFNELNNTFITPFDREDIHTLATQIDDILDMINASAKRTILYQPKEMPQSMLRIAKHIQEMTLSLQTAVYGLEKAIKNAEVIKQQCKKLHQLENSADDVYENYIISLFEQEKNAIELLKLVEIIQLLESTTDKAYRASDVLKTIIVKYS